MARKHVAKHLKKLDSHHKKFRKQIYKHLKKLARHKGCYVDGPVKRGKTGGSSMIGGTLGLGPSSTRGSLFGSIGSMEDIQKRAKKNRSMSAADFKKQQAANVQKGFDDWDKQQLRRRAQAKQPKRPQQKSKLDWKAFRSGSSAPPASHARSMAKVQAAAQKAIAAQAKGASGVIGGSGWTVGGSGWSRGRMARKKGRAKGKKKKRKLPAWVTKPVPKGKKYPKAPRGFSKEASGFFDSIKAGASALGKTFSNHADTIKKIGSAMGKTALDLGTQYISGKIQEGQAMAQQKIEQAQALAQQYANQAQNQVQGYVQQGQQYGQQMYNQGQQYAQGMYQQGMAQGQQYVDQGGRMVRQGMQNAKQAIYDEFGNIMGYR